MVKTAMIHFYYFYKLLFFIKIERRSSIPDKCQILNQVAVKKIAVGELKSNISYMEISALIHSNFVGIQEIYFANNKYLLSMKYLTSP